MANNLKELFSYRLNVLSTLSTRVAAARNEHEHALSLRDWRIVALLGAFSPMSLNGLAREAHLDKSQASRSITRLTERGLVSRVTAKTDRRSVKLGLTSSGRSVYRRAFLQTLARNELLLAPLSSAERGALDRILAKLTERALAVLAEEPKHPTRARKPSKHAKPVPKTKRPTLHVRAA